MPRTLKGTARALLNQVLEPLDLRLVRRSVVDPLLSASERAPLRRHDEALLPPGAAERLSLTHPRLVELRARYAGHPAARHSQWSEEYLRRELDLRYFRADNAYLYQGRDSRESEYALATYYVQRADSMGLLERLEEDEAFGNEVHLVDGKHLVSRDLLDSVLELHFIERCLGLSSRTSPAILDIGAGYGRLAHRATAAFPHVHVLCTDAVAESTFLCEYYLEYRGVERAEVLPLDRVEDELQRRRIDVATNIHSFSECSIESIRWWCDLLARHRVPYLMIVPNDDRLLSNERDGRRYEYQPVLEELGYALVRREPKYEGAPSVQKHGAFPAEYFLFERRV